MGHSGSYRWLLVFIQAVLCIATCSSPAQASDFARTPPGCTGVSVPAVHMHDPENGETNVRRDVMSVVLEIFSPIGRPTVRLYGGANPIPTRETFFLFLGYSPKPRQGFVVHNFGFDNLLAPMTMYKVEVGFDWAAPGPCREFFTVGTFTTGKTPTVAPPVIRYSPPATLPHV
jgi:hypothetical protein